MLATLRWWRQASLTSVGVTVYYPRLTACRQPAYSVDCGSVTLGKEATFRIAAKGGSNEIGVGVPVGTQCKVVETDAGGADATTVSVIGGAAQDARSAIATVRASGTTVTFTNAFEAAPDNEPRPRPLPDPEPKPEPPPTLPATGSDTMMQLVISLAALLLGGTLMRVTRPRSRGWLRA